MDKKTVLAAKWDMLGQTVLNECGAHKYGPLCEPTWSRVERALPIMRYSRGNRQARGGGPVEWMCSPYAEESGVRTFVGSRSSSVDATFSDHADDCTDNGFPRPQTYVMNLTAIAHGEPAIKDFIHYLNFTTMGDGLVGGVTPNAIFYFPVLKQNFSAFGGARYWTMIASPVPDMQGGREQSVWFRFQQLMCKGEEEGSPYLPIAPCHLHGTPQYYDTYWYVRLSLSREAATNTRTGACNNAPFTLSDNRCCCVSHPSLPHTHTGTQTAPPTSPTSGSRPPIWRTPPASIPTLLPSNGTSASISSIAAAQPPHHHHHHHLLLTLHPPSFSAQVLG